MYAYGALTVGLEGKELPRSACTRKPARWPSPMPTMRSPTPMFMRRALYYAKTFDALIVHLPQEPTLSGGTMTSGAMATRLGLSGSPPLAEVMMVERDIRWPR